MAIQKPKAPASTGAPAATPETVENIGADVQNMTAQERLALLAELMQAQQADVAPLEEQKRELLAKLAEINEQIEEIKPDNSPLAAYRAVYAAVKAGKKSVEDIAEAAELETATVEAILKKHLVSKDVNHDPIFTLKNGDYILTPKTKKP